MAGRHIRTNDDYREPGRHGTAPRGKAREPVAEDRRRKETKNRRIEEPMDVDMDDDSDDYDHRRGANKRTEKYSSATRIPAIPATTNRHGRGDRSPPEEMGRTIINAIPERDAPRVRPGTDRDFWIPDAGIEREVITYEITRYLGQDALVRPGKNDVRVASYGAGRSTIADCEQKGQKGYLITALRAPTTVCPCLYTQKHCRLT